MPETLTGRERDLFLTIARCPVIRDVREGRAHGCGCQSIVNLQRNRPPDSHVAEPWTGHIARAPILFIASNPGWSDEDDSRGAVDDEELIDAHINFFGEGLEQYSVGGIRAVRNGVPDRQWVRYWAFARRRAIELLGEGVRPGEDYALTEVVHCNSKTETSGAVWEALTECTGRYLDGVLAIAAARIIIVVGDVAAEALRRRGFEPALRVIGPVHLAGMERMVVFLPHPNKRGGPKSLVGRVPDRLQDLRRFVARG
jgi:hypothetical protein